MREASKIVVLAIVAAVAYGVALDQVTVRISLAYFAVAHRPLVASQSPAILALAWGIAATWLPGAGLGVLLATAARAGPFPPHSAASVTGPLLRLLGTMALVALAAGCIGWTGAQRGLLRLVEPMASAIAREEHARFFAVWGATLGSYATGIGGGLWLCAGVWRQRTSDRHRNESVGMDRTGAWMFYGSLAGLALLVGLPLALAWSVAGSMLRPPWYVHPGPGAALPEATLRDPRAAFGLAFEDVVFETDAGAQLRGWWIPGRDSERCAAVLAGGGWSDRRSLLAIAPALHRDGIGVLAFDYREHGSSDGSGRGASYGLRESRDVEAAVRFAKREQRASHVAVVGYSMGGSAAILAAAEPGTAIDAIVATTPGTTLADLLETAPEGQRVPLWMRGLVARVLLLRIGAPLGAVLHGDAGPLGVVARVAPRPLLLLHGRDDPVNAVADARRLFERAGEPKQLVVVGGAAHLDVIDDPGGEIPRRIARFIAREACAAAQ